MALAPVALLLILYYPIFSAWFQLDDLEWLSLGNTLRNGRSLLWALFSPQAQGTIRPLSERLYFLAASRLFGLNPLPFRIVALVTQTGSLRLLVEFARRTTNLPWTGAIAGMWWVCHPALGDAHRMASAYNQVLYGFAFLGGLVALVRYVETGAPPIPVAGRGSVRCRPRK